MRRSLILAAALWPLMNVAANAACPTTPGMYGCPMMTETSNSVLYASAFGVVADGTTSDDVALKAAIDACSAKGTKLFLPPGAIKLTGAAQSTLENCHIVGAGGMAGTQALASQGTVFYITNTSVGPFIIKSNWGMEFINFYWTGQTTGAVVYAPLFQDGGAASIAGSFFLDHVTIVNAYDGFAQTPGSSWGNIYITNSAMYAVRDLFRMSYTGDMIHMSNMHFTSGPWQQMSPFDLVAPLNEAQKRNTILHVLSGPIVQMMLTNVATFSWRYGIYVDNGGTFGSSDIRAFSVDNVGSIVDTSAGGTFNGQISGGGGCATTLYPGGGKGGNAPCFNLSANGSLILRDFNFASQGSGITTLGSSVTVQNSNCDGIGSVVDAGDYACIDVKGVTGGTTIRVQEASLTGINNSVHTFGIKSGANVIPNFILQNSSFLFFQAPVSVSFANVGIATGNSSGGTKGSVSFIVPNTSTLVYNSNSWDKPPTATVSACGTGASINGGLAGTIFPGTGAPITTQCTLTLPWEPLLAGGIGSGSCHFTPSISIIISGGPSGVPPAWTFNSGGTDMHGAQIFYSCGGAQ